MTTHTDHPMRHWDRTCPACNEGATSMTDLRKAAEMALEALLNYPMTEGKAIQALRQALVHTEQSVEPPDYVEPITFDYHDGWEEGFKAGVESIQNKKGLTPSNVSPVLHGGDKNYTELAQPEQEPVNIHCPSCLHYFSIVPVAKREWVGLTGEEVDAIRKDIFEKYKNALVVTRDVTNENNYSAFNFYQAIEKKLRSKND